MAGEIQIGGTSFATESGGTVTIANVDSATNRQNLGVEIGVDVQAYDADTTKNDLANTFTANQIITVTDNTNAALRVTQLGTGNALVVEDSTNPDSTPFVVDATGQVMVGTTADVYGDSAPVHIKQTNTSSGNNACLALQNMNASGGSGVRTVVFMNSSGSVGGAITQTSTATAYNTSSDYRLKENITDITDAITRFKQLNPSRFNFIIDSGRIVDGFIAHEVQDVVPEAITGEKDSVNEDGSINPQGIDQSKLVPLITAALQESIALIESQQSQIDALTALIEALETT